MSAKVTDSASSTILGEEVSDGKPLSSELLNEIFAAPGDDYNELRVGRSDVLGWFVSLQSAPVVRLRSPAVLVDGVMVEAGILPQRILLGEIIRQAGDLPVFVFHQGQICQVTVDPEAFAPVSAASLYA